MDEQEIKDPEKEEENEEEESKVDEGEHLEKMVHRILN